MRWSCKFKLQLNWVDLLGQNYNFKNIIICKPKIDLSFFKIELIPSKVKYSKIIFYPISKNFSIRRNENYNFK